MTRTAEAPRLPFTVWRFESPSTGQVAVVARHSEPDDIASQHAFQKVLWRDMAANQTEALVIASMTVR